MNSVVSTGDIDRMFENIITIALYEAGWYPDKQKFVQDILNAADEEEKEAIQQAFAQEKKALLEAGTFAQPFGVGNYKDRKELKANNIIIDREGITPSTDNFLQRKINFEEYQVEVDGETKTRYCKSRLGVTPEDIEYSITIVCEDSKSERILTDIMLNTFPIRKFATPYRENWVAYDFDVFIERSVIGNVSGTDYMERIFRYIVREVVIEREQIIDEAVPAIEKVEISLIPVLKPSPTLDDIQDVIDTEFEP